MMALWIENKLISDESDEEDDRPSRKRRLAERAVEGEAADDEEV